MGGSSSSQITHEFQNIGNALNRFILKNDAYGTSTKRIGAIVLADIVSTLAVEYLNGQPLMIL